MSFRLGLTIVSLALVGCATKPTTVSPASVSSPPLTSSNTDDPKDLSVLLAPIIARHNVPGMAAVVLRGNKVLAQGVAGVRKRGATELITIDDQFLLCSGGKAMTATLAAMAVEEGRLSWNATLGEIFSDAIKGLDPGWNAVTVAQLLDHRSGVPADSALFWPLVRLQFSHTSPEEKRHAIIAKVLSKRPRYQPGSRYVYASVDYVIVGAILEKIYGQSWETLIDDRLWKPLGITSGGFGVPGTPGKIDQPWGHWGMLFPGRPTGPGSLWANLSAPAFAGPGGTECMTITDWAKFIALHLGGDPANPHHSSGLLQAQSFEKLHQSEPGRFYESGWILRQRPWANGHRPGNIGRVICSEGDNGFWHCEAWLAPEIDFAVIVTCNQGGASADKPANIASQEVLSSLLEKFGPK